MTRRVKEWIGRSDDTVVPPRVRLRVWKKDGKACAQCTRSLPAEAFETDHKQAIINGGANRESNLRTLCEWCHKKKTAGDVAEKSAVYGSQLRHTGIQRKRKWPSLPGGRDDYLHRKKTIAGRVVVRQTLGQKLAAMGLIR